MIILGYFGWKTKDGWCESTYLNIFCFHSHSEIQKYHADSGNGWLIQLHKVEID